MAKKDIAIVFDCGTTNVRAMAMDNLLKIIASKAMPDVTDDDPVFPGDLIWDVD